MKTCKKLLAIALVAVMLVSTLVSGLAVSAAEIPTLSVVVADTTITAGQDATVDVTVTSDMPVDALHMLATVESTLAIDSAVIKSVDYATQPADPSDPDLESPALKIEGDNLAEGKILFGSGVQNYVAVNSVVFTLTFKAVAEGEYDVKVNIASTDYNEANIPATEATGKITAAAAHVCEGTVLVDNQNGTHDVKCACGEVVTAGVACTYVDGFCACGAEEPVYEDANLKIRGAGITMANGFALDFKVRKTMETSLGYSDIYIVFQKPRYDEEGNVTETIESIVTYDQKTNDPTNAENYLYTLEGVQPQEIGTTVTATIYGTKDGHIYKGATVEYSVLKFTTNQLKSLTSSSNATALQVTCADIIVYGAAVQDYAKYNTANSIIAAADALCGSDVWQNFATAEITRELVNAQTNTALEGQNVRIRSAGVVLSSKVILYFNCANMGVTTLANRENYVCRVSYVDVTGETKTYDLEINESNQALLDTLYSTELGTVVTANLVEKATGNVVSNTVTYSIETFLGKNLTNATMGGWCTALAKYGDSVRAYAGLK